MTKAARRAVIAAAVLVAACVAVRLVLDPIATHQTRKALAGLDGYEGELERVHVTILPPGYEIERLAVWKAPHGSRREPLFFVERARARVAWRELFHARLVADLRLEEPKMSIIETAAPSPSEAKAPAPPDVSAQLARILPFRLERLELLDGELLFRDATQPRHPEVWVHHLELAAENVPTRRALAGGRPATVSARGVVGRSGALTLFVSADPFARPLAFAGQVSLEHFRAAELYAFLEPKAHVQTPEGTIDVFAEFAAKDGRLRGGVKAMLKNVEVRPTSDGVWDRLRAWLGDKAIEVASDRVPGRNAVATTIPIEGSLIQPDVQLWPAVLGVVRNAFVAGLRSGFSNLPPPRADGHESVLTQAENALEKSKGPPKAQPAKEPPARHGGE
jgi:hypothetical protein